MFFLVTEISENRVAGIKVIFWIFFSFLKKSLWALPQEVCYTHSHYLLTNALQQLRFKNTGQNISVSE